MKIAIIAVAAAAVLASSGAFAFHCPSDMAKIDAALAKNPQLTSDQMAAVKKYRSEGETLHKAGKHQESVDALAKAEKILNIHHSRGFFMDRSRAESSRSRRSRREALRMQRPKSRPFREAAMRRMHRRRT